MVEQYIYSRSDTGFVNSRNQKIDLGYGFVAASPGLGEGLRRSLSPHCSRYTNDGVNDADGHPVQMLRKSLLDDQRTVLQSNVFLEGEGKRNFHAAHGYVLPTDNDFVSHPEKWFGLPFFTTDPNLVAGGVLLDTLETLPGHFVPQPLPQVLAAFGLDADTFHQLVMACFEVLDGRRQVMILYDFTRPDAILWQQNLLYWIYLFLPLQVRCRLGFDSVYSSGSAPRAVHLVFVSQAMVQSMGNQLTVGMGRNAIMLNNHYVMHQGAVMFARKRWLPQDGVYCRWLNAAVQAVCQDSTAAAAVNALYIDFDQQLAASGLQTSLERPLYDALCWSALTNGPAAILSHVRLEVPVTTSETELCHMTVLTRMGDSGAVTAVLQEVMNRYKTPADSTDVKLLVMALQSRASEQAKVLLGAFLARDLDADDTSQDATLARYQSVLPADCFHDLLGMVLLYGAPKEYTAIWHAMRADATRTAAACRRRTWYHNRTQECPQITTMPGELLDAIEQLPIQMPKIHTALVGEIVQHAQKRLQDELPQPSMKDIADLAVDLQRQRERPDAKLFIPLMETMIRAYIPRPEEATLDRLDTVAQLFLPLDDDTSARRLEMLLYKVELEQLLSAGAPPFEPTEQMFTQVLRTAVRMEHLSYDTQTLAERRRLIFDRAFTALLRQPPVFMTGEWLQNNVPQKLDPTPGSVLAAQRLEAFCSGAQSMERWRRLQAQEPLSGDAYQMAFGALPQLFLNGALPDVQEGFIMLFIRRCPESVDKLLERTVRQGGSRLLLKVVQYAIRFQRRFVVRRQEGDDLSFLLHSIGNDETLLDEIAQANGSPEFDADIIGKLPGLAARHSLTLQDAQAIARKLNAHYERNARGRSKAAVRRTVAKLSKSGT